MADKIAVNHSVEEIDDRTSADRLAKTLGVYARSTSAGIRTDTNEIRFKLAHPGTAKGQLVFLALLENRETVGFALMAYFGDRRTIVIDHMAIEEGHRRHGAFYVFSSLIQQLIVRRFPDYDYVVAEAPTDKMFADDGVNGRALVRLLRTVGFGRVQIPYCLPNNVARTFRKSYEASLMVKGRAEDRGAPVRNAIGSSGCRAVRLLPRLV